MSVILFVSLNGKIMRAGRLIVRAVRKKKKTAKKVSTATNCVTYSYFICGKKKSSKRKTNINVGINRRIREFRVTRWINSTATNYLGYRWLFLLAIVRHDVLAEAAGPPQRGIQRGSMRYVPDEKRDRVVSVYTRAPANTWPLADSSRLHGVNWSRVIYTCISASWNPAKRDR